MDNFVSFISDPKVITAVLACCVAVITYMYQSIAKLQEHRRDKKRELYERLVENVFRLLDAKAGAERSAVLTNIEMSWLFAPDDVLLACYDVLKAFEYASEHQDASISIRKDKTTRDMFEIAVSKLFVAMRKDLKFTKTNIDVTWANKQIKIYDQEVIGSFN